MPSLPTTERQFQWLRTLAASAMDKIGGGLSKTAASDCRRFAAAVRMIHGRDVDDSRHSDILAEWMRGLQE